MISDESAADSKIPPSSLVCVLLGIAATTMANHRRKLKPMIGGKVKKVEAFQDTAALVVLERSLRSERMSEPPVDRSIPTRKSSTTIWKATLRKKSRHRASLYSSQCTHYLLSIRTKI
ncbi:hypothetical protein U1Q18_007992 [Sarracenia purpurea var. burkii]